MERRLKKSCKADPPNKARIFAKLILEGQINSALQYLSKNDGGRVLPLTDDVTRQLREKHPEAQKAKIGSLLFGPVEDIPDTIYQQINGELIREAALRTKGSGSPSGVDATALRECWHASPSRDQVPNFATLLLHLHEDFARNLLIR